MQLNAESQRIARRHKKAFFNEQCKGKQLNGKDYRHFIRNIGEIKETFHARVGTIKDRNCKDLTEAEEIKKTRQEYTEELYKKHINDPDNQDGLVTHLEPGILECEVKWALGSISMNKASADDGIPVELFQILKDDAVKMLH